MAGKPDRKQGIAAGCDHPHLSPLGCRHLKKAGLPSSWTPVPKTRWNSWIAPESNQLCFFPCGKTYTSIWDFLITIPIGHGSRMKSASFAYSCRCNFQYVCPRRPAQRIRFPLSETENLYNASHRLALANDYQEMVSAITLGFRNASLNRGSGTL